ncbi:MAG: hypothetical protein WBE39_04220 [Candidatus Competibacter sp.]
MTSSSGHHVRRSFDKNAGPSRFFLYLLSCLPLFCLAWLNRHYQLDDALIYLRYVDNFLNGEGLVYNPGIYFNGLTSPLYSYCVILVGWLISNLQATNILLAALFHASASIVFAETFFTQQSVAAGCAFIILSGTFPYFFLVYGMETPLLMLLIGLCFYFYQTKNYFWLGIFSGLLILTRVESIFLIVAFLIGYFIKYRTFPAYRNFIVPLILIATNLIFNKLYYGSYLPATGNAKIWQGRSGLWGDGWVFLNAGYLLAWAFGSNRFYFLTVFGFSVIGFLKTITTFEHREVHWIILFFLFGYSLFFIFLNIPNYHWYYAPYFIFTLLYCTKGLFFIPELFEGLVKSDLKWSAFLPSLLVMTALIYWAGGLSSLPRGPLKAYRDIGVWLNQNTASGDQIAVVEIGTIGWYSKRPIIDILGLVNPLNARFLGERKFEEWLNHYSPDFILIHDPPWPHELGAVNALAAGRFGVDPRFHFQNYRLLRKLPQPEQKS